MGDVARGGSDAAEQPQSVLFGCALLLVAMVGAFLAIAAYAGLQSWHRPVGLTVTSGSLAGLQDLTLTSTAGGGPAVRWSLAGTVSRLSFGGPEPGSAVVVVPLVPSACAAMAAQLHASCAGGEVQTGAPLQVTWSDAQEISVSGAAVAQSLEVIPAVPPPAQVTLFVRTASTPDLCFLPSSQAVRLGVTQGGYSFAAAVPGHQSLTCSTGLRIRVGSGESGPPPTVELQHIASFGLTASAPVIMAQGFAGTISLSPGGRTVLGSPGDMTVSGRGLAALRAQLGIGTGSQPLAVSSRTATSVVTGDGELVPSEWNRASAVLGPLLGGVVTAAVVAPLGASVQVLINAARRQHWWFRRIEIRLRRLLRRWRARLFRALGRVRSRGL